MSEPIQHFVGRRQPPLEATIFTDGSTDPLPAGATVSFSMRAVGSSTLKVNAAAATVVSEPLNQVRYDWAAADVNTADYYLGWWRVTAGGQDTDTPEFLIWIADHAPTVGYIELEELKSTLEVTTTTGDADMRLAIEAASTVVDMLTGRSFATPASSTKKYTPIAEDFLAIDRVASLTSVVVNGATWVVDTDFYVNPAGDMLHVLNGRKFFRGPQSVSVTASYGFTDVPSEIRAATTIIASQIMKRAREATFGVLSLTLDGSAVRIGRTDPQVDLLLAKWRRVMVE